MRAFPFDNAPDSIGRAVDWVRNLEKANLRWVGDSRARIVENMIEEGQVFKLDGGHKGGKWFSCGEVGHIPWSCSRSARGKTGKWVRCIGRGMGKCFGGNSVAQ